MTEIDLYILAFFITFIIIGFILTSKQPKQQLKEYKHIMTLSDLQSIHPREFELFCGDMLLDYGFNEIQVTDYVNDGGVDIFAKYEDQKFIIECKRYGEQSIITRPIIQKLHSASIMNNAKGIILTTGRYSPNVLEYAKKAGIICVPNDVFIEYLNKKQIEVTY